MEFGRLASLSLALVRYHCRGRFLSRPRKRQETLICPDFVIKKLTLFKLLIVCRNFLGQMCGHIVIDKVKNTTFAVANRRRRCA